MESHPERIRQPRRLLWTVSATVLVHSRRSLAQYSLVTNPDQFSRKNFFVEPLIAFFRLLRALIGGKSVAER